MIVLVLIDIDMAFTKVDELTIDEALALALVEFMDKGFTEKEVATYLSLFLSDRLRPCSFMVVRRIVDSAVEQGLLQTASGPRGVDVFRVSRAGAELVSNVDLPVDLYAKRIRLDRERNAEANANAGPSMLQLLEMIPSDKRQCQGDGTYVKSVFRQWRDQGWLSSRQAERIAEIGAWYGFFVPAHHYVGRAMAEWRQPYLDAEVRKASGVRTPDRLTKAVEAAPVRDPRQIRAAALQANRQLKAELEQMERNGELDQLDQLVRAVFPGTTLTRPAKFSAYAGAGSKALRVCIAGLAFGKPPAVLWKQSGQMRHPNAESEEWRTLINQPSFQAVDRRAVSG